MLAHLGSKPSHFTYGRWSILCDFIAKINFSWSKFVTDSKNPRPQVWKWESCFSGGYLHPGEMKYKCLDISYDLYIIRKVLINYHNNHTLKINISPDISIKSKKRWRYWLRHVKGKIIEICLIEVRLACKYYVETNFQVRIF